MGPHGLSSFVGVGILELNSPLLVLLLFFFFFFFGISFSGDFVFSGKWGMLMGKGFWGFFFFSGG